MNLIDLLKLYSILSEDMSFDIDENKKTIVVRRNKEKIARIELYDEQLFNMLKALIHKHT